MRSKLGGATNVAISSNGKWSVAMGCFENIQGKPVNLARIDLSTGKIIVLLAKGLEDVKGIALSPDDKTIALGFGSDEIKLWSVSDRKEMASWKLRNFDGVRSLAYFNAGKRLAVTNRGGTKVIELEATTGQIVRTLWPEQ